MTITLKLSAKIRPIIFVDIRIILLSHTSLCGYVSMCACTSCIVKDIKLMPPHNYWLGALILASIIKFNTSFLLAYNLDKYCVSFDVYQSYIKIVNHCTYKRFIWSSWCISFLKAVPFYIHIK